MGRGEGGGQRGTETGGMWRRGIRKQHFARSSGRWRLNPGPWREKPCCSGAVLSEPAIQLLKRTTDAATWAPVAFSRSSTHVPGLKFVRPPHTRATARPLQARNPSTHASITTHAESHNFSIASLECASAVDLQCCQVPAGDCRGQPRSLGWGARPPTKWSFKGRDWHATNPSPKRTSMGFTV